MYSKVNAAAITGTFANLSENQIEAQPTDLVYVYSTLDQDVALRLDGACGAQTVLVPANSFGLPFPSDAGSVAIKHVGTQPNSGSIVINRYRSGV